MAKTIKFNLICDGNPVRTLEDLRNNFSVEDVLEYYKNKLLHRWLTVRGYLEELAKVQGITETDDLKLIKKLILVFDVEVEEILIEQNTYVLQYNKEREALLEKYEMNNYKTNEILEDYHAGYIEVVNRIIENKDDMPKIKSAIKEIDHHYGKIYDLNYRNLFYIFLKQAPMAIFAMLINDNMRSKYLPVITINEDGTKTSDIDINYDKKDMYNSISTFTSSYDELKNTLGNNLKEFCGVTEGYWKDVETKGKSFMIIKIEPGNFIRASGITGGDLNSDDIKNNFLMIDGIDYKSNYALNKILYMEV